MELRVSRAGSALTPFFAAALPTDYATAKQVFVSGDPNAGMQAFMQGKVRVQGDMAKLMASQQGGGNPKLQEAIQAATE